MDPLPEVHLTHNLVGAKKDQDESTPAVVKQVTTFVDAIIGLLVWCTPCETYIFLYREPDSNYAAGYKGT